MNISSKGVKLLKSLDPFIPSPREDDDGAKRIGYGHKIASTESELLNGITKAQADRLLEFDLQKVQKAVNAGLKRKVTQAQFDALCSWAYSVGANKAVGAEQSDLFKMINRGDSMSKIGKFWTTTYIKRGGVKVASLMERREKEFSWFSSSELVNKTVETRTPTSTPSPASYAQESSQAPVQEFIPEFNAATVQISANESTQAAPPPRPKPEEKSPAIWVIGGLAVAAAIAALVHFKGQSK